MNVGVEGVELKYVAASGPWLQFQLISTNWF